jgi:hypothetical protein
MNDLLFIIPNEILFQEIYNFLDNKTKIRLYMVNKYNHDLIKENIKETLNLDINELMNKICHHCGDLTPHLVKNFCHLCFDKLRCDLCYKVINNGYITKTGHWMSPYNICTTKKFDTQYNYLLEKDVRCCSVKCDECKKIVKVEDKTIMYRIQKDIQYKNVRMHYDDYNHVCTDCLNNLDENKENYELISIYKL